MAGEKGRGDRLLDEVDKLIYTRWVYPGSDDCLREMYYRLSHHPATAGQLERREEIAAAAMALAVRIIKNTPPCREQSFALARLEEATVWAEAAMTRHEVGPDAAKGVDPFQTP